MMRAVLFLLALLTLPSVPASALDGPCRRFNAEARRDAHPDMPFFEACTMPDGIHGWRVTGFDAGSTTMTPEELDLKMQDHLVKMGEDMDFIDEPGCDRATRACNARLDDAVKEATWLQNEIGALAYKKFRGIYR